MKTVKKSIISIGLLSILLVSLMAYMIPFALADKDGIGKYVEIIVIGGEESLTSVTLTKLSSGETWNTDDYGYLYEKVGAGLVRVEAKANGNYVFDYFEIDDELIIEDPSYEFRTKKGITKVEAFFKRLFLIKAFVSLDAYDGLISVEEAGERLNYWEFTVEEGSRPEFWFYPNEGYHISGISQNGVFLPPNQYLQLPEVFVDYEIEVFFSADGQAWIPTGENVEVYFTEGASLRFDEVTTASTASGLALIRPEDWGFFLWDISTVVVDIIDGKVTITLQIEGQQDIDEVLVTDDEDAFYCDVNDDGVVDGDDISDVANGIKTTSQSGAEYDPRWDVNRDGELTEDDIHFVNAYKGTEISWDYLIENVDWTYYYDETNDVTVIQIDADHFSIFRGR